MRPADILALAADAGVTIELKGNRLRLSSDERPPMAFSDLSATIATSWFSTSTSRQP
jgi:hypothetical protein